MKKDMKKDMKEEMMKNKKIFRLFLKNFYIIFENYLK